MKLLSGFRYAATFVFFLLLAAPAFAQFEISPDHFDENRPTTKKAVSMKKQPGQINSRPRAAVGKASTIKIRTSKTLTRVSVAGTGKAFPSQKVRNCYCHHRRWHAQSSAVANKPEGTSIGSASGVNGKAKSPVDESGV